MLRGVGESPVAERLAVAQDRLYGPLLDWAADSRVFHTDLLGHSPHPTLTDVTVGCWLSASVVDATGGAADWARMTGAPRRIGAVHALGTDLAIYLFVGSLAARLRGRDTAGARLAAAGNLVMVAAGFLGAHLALSRGAARRPGVPGQDSALSH